MKAYHFEGEEKIPSPALIYYPEINVYNGRKSIQMVIRHYRFPEFP